MVVADDRLRGRVSSSRRGIKSVVTRRRRRRRVTLEEKREEKKKKKRNNDKKRGRNYILVSRRISLSVIYLSRPMITRWIVVT